MDLEHNFITYEDVRLFVSFAFVVISRNPEFSEVLILRNIYDFEKDTKR